MDVRMPVMDGLQATREILGAAGGLRRPRVLMLTTFDLHDYVYAALRGGQRFPAQGRYGGRAGQRGARGRRR
jgi:DNA-binding NarL/FixJ family response regulator